jgi:hypothetical protein
LARNPVHLLAMRVGFIKQLLWERYGQVWQNLLSGVETDILEATPDKTLQQFESVPTDISGLSFKLAVAEALALGEADLLIVPDLNPSETVQRGSGQDPWIASFPEALQRIAGLPPIVKVPATLEANLEPLILETLLSVKRDPAKVRLVYERNLPNLKAKRYTEPRWTKLPGQQETAAVIGQPWLVTSQVLALLNFSETHLVSQQQLSPASLKDEAKRLEQRLIATDAEVLGAAHFFNRKGTVDKLFMMVDNTSGADVWLEKQVRKMVSKPLEVVYVQDLLAGDISRLLSAKSL